MTELFDRNKNNNAYRVPEGYFSTLNARIMQSVKDADAKATAAESSATGKDAQQGKRTRTGIFRLSPKYRYAVAACFTAVIVVAGIAAFKLSTANPDTAMAETMAINQQQNNNGEAYSEEYQQECLDYAMVDNDDMYIYLAEQ